MRRRAAGGERGSALLIVFVFAAIIAIMLFMELPVAVFEAKRQKEQLLIDRGNEYAHAVKLFVRKTGTYPASIDALESTNNMRFLRHRFKDPFTGKDDWRLLHAGPGGMLIDSKVQQTAQNNPNGTGRNAANGQGSSSFGSSSFGGNSSFGSSSFGGNSSTTSSNNNGFNNASSPSSDASTGSDVVVPPLPQRAPAIAANGSNTATASASNPLTPLLPDPSASGSAGNATASSAAGTGQTNTGSTNAAAGTQTAANQTGTGTASGPTSSFGNMMSGGIAGVASKASGHSIKEVNDQTNYALWEFYYDPTKDANKGIASALGQMGAGAQTNANSSSTNGSAFGSSSAFGSNNSGSAFGNSSTGSAFGSSSSNSSFGAATNGATPAPSTTTPSPTPQQ